MENSGVVQKLTNTVDMLYSFNVLVHVRVVVDVRAGAREDAGQEHGAVQVSKRKRTSMSPSSNNT